MPFAPNACRSLPLELVVATGLLDDGAAAVCAPTVDVTVVD
jgi:hypothetical protein